MGGIVSCVLLNEIQITIVAIETLLFAASLFSFKFNVNSMKLKIGEK